MTYRERLRLEGASLAISGAIGTILLLVLEHDAATSGLTSTVVQVAIVAVLMATVGLRSVRRSMASAVPVEEAGSGQPTPLWQHPLIVAGLTLPFGLADAWDAGLRVCGGCTVVGLAQIAFSSLVAREEANRGARYFRVPGSSIVRGTKLGTAP